MKDSFSSKETLKEGDVRIMNVRLNNHFYFSFLLFFILELEIRISRTL